MDAIDRWIGANDPGAETVPVILPGFSDSRWFREAFPDCVAYGFFPQRHMTCSRPRRSSTARTSGSTSATSGSRPASTAICPRPPRLAARCD